LFLFYIKTKLRSALLLWAKALVCCFILKKTKEFACATPWGKSSDFNKNQKY
jgi:hypothetical protein